MLIYLIYLRSTRLSAEDWLEKNHNILFSHAASILSEDRILEELIKNKDLASLLENRNIPTTPPVNNNFAGGTMHERLIDHEEERSNNSSSSKGNKKGGNDRTSSSSSSSSNDADGNDKRTGSSNSKQRNNLPKKQFSNEPSGSPME